MTLRRLSSVATKCVLYIPCITPQVSLSIISHFPSCLFSVFFLTHTSAKNDKLEMPQEKKKRKAMEYMFCILLGENIENSDKKKRKIKPPCLFL